MSTSIKTACPPLPQQIDRSASLLKLLSDPTRLRIVLLLTGRQLCVCELIAYLALPQNLVSHHLAQLRRAKLVQAHRQGRKLYYQLNAKLICDITSLLALLDAKGLPDSSINQVSKCISR